MGHHKKHHKHKHHNEELNSQLDLNNVDMSQIQNIMQNIDMNQLSAMLSNLNLQQGQSNINLPQNNLTYPQNNVIAVLSALKPFLPEHRSMIIDRIIESLTNIPF